MIATFLLVRAAVGIPGHYICAAEDNYCDCPGMVSYGYGPIWTSNGRMGSQMCDDDNFGNPLYGYEKYCMCDLSMISGTCASEEGQCECARRVWYGRDNTWITNGIKGTQSCSNSVFGDPLPGTKKECLCEFSSGDEDGDTNEYEEGSDDDDGDTNESEEGSDDDDDVGSVCVREGEYCGCRGKIWYGNGDIMVQNDVWGSQWCTNGRFGDPVPGIGKYCTCESNPESDVDVCAPLGRVAMLCAEEGEKCKCDRGYVSYGEQSSWVSNKHSGSVVCNGDMFGMDSTAGKKCLCVQEY